jgi:hypothetical protein
MYGRNEKFETKNLKRKDHLAHSREPWSLILKLILKKQVRTMWPGLIWLSIQSHAWLL